MGVTWSMRGYRSNPQHGFTLTELLVALVIASVLIAAVYQTFHSQQRSYTLQSETAAMEQNLRGGLYVLTRELRSAGYNPTQATINDFRFVTSFPPRLTVSITASATFCHPGWWTGSKNSKLFKGIGASTWDVACWGGRRHEQGLFSHTLRNGNNL